MHDAARSIQALLSGGVHGLMRGGSSVVANSRVLSLVTKPGPKALAQPQTIAPAEVGVDAASPSPAVWYTASVRSFGAERADALFTHGHPRPYLLLPLAPPPMDDNGHAIRYATSSHAVELEGLSVSSSMSLVSPPLEHIRSQREDRVQSEVPFGVPQVFAADLLIDGVAVELEGLGRKDQHHVEAADNDLLTGTKVTLRRVSERMESAQPPQFRAPTFVVDEALDPSIRSALATLEPAAISFRQMASRVAEAQRERSRNAMLASTQHLLKNRTSPFSGNRMEFEGLRPTFRSAPPVNGAAGDVLEASCDAGVREYQGAEVGKKKTRTFLETGNLQPPARGLVFDGFTVEGSSIVRGGLEKDRRRLRAPQMLLADEMRVGVRDEGLFASDSSADAKHSAPLTYSPITPMVPPVPALHHPVFVSGIASYLDMDFALVSAKHSGLLENPPDRTSAAQNPSTGPTFVSNSSHFPYLWMIGISDKPECTPPRRRSSTLRAGTTADFTRSLEAAKSTYLRTSWMDSGGPGAAFRTAVIRRVPVASCAMFEHGSCGVFRTRRYTYFSAPESTCFKSSGIRIRLAVVWWKELVWAEVEGNGIAGPPQILY
ncbi:hypothetical protein B0H11DRAFT_1912602 [Mycena galericulata]|nr:hypothetical protein B0H11DRAFT_1912602 [Mycena galericulata]